VHEEPVAPVRPHAGCPDVIVDCVVPARDEAQTVTAVVRACRGCRYVREVIVVDDGSSDGTADAAQAAGAKVVRREASDGGSKGMAMGAGVDASDAEAILFVDADCVGLTSAHLDAICAPVVEGRAAMSLGTFDYGPLNWLVLRLPPTTGERILPRWLFEALPPSKRQGYTIEIFINEVVTEARLPISSRTMRGVTHRTKRDKLGLVAGYRASWKMFRQLWKLWGVCRKRTYWFYLRDVTIERSGAGNATKRETPPS
jgi:glycosyltransferase involved in cell wall biosynthesis